MSDANVITGIGMFFREFAQTALNRLGYDVGERFMDTSIGRMGSTRSFWRN